MLHSIFTHRIFIIISLFCLISCRNENLSTKCDQTVIIRIDDNLVDNKFTDYNNLIDSIEIVKLETSKNSLIGNIRKTIYFNNKLYVDDISNSSIIIFNRNGSFVDKLSKRGKGPDEYIELRDFQIDDSGNIHVLTYNGIKTYNPSLSLTNYIKFNYNKRGIENNLGRSIQFIYNEKYLFTYCGSFGLKEFAKKKDFALICLDSNQNIVSKYLPVKYEYSAGHQHFFYSNEKIYFTNTRGNDTIYQLQSNTLIPKYYIDYGKNRLTENDMEKGRQELYMKSLQNHLMGNNQDVYENNKYLCFTTSYGNLMKQIIYNKNSKKIMVLNIGTKTLPFPTIRIIGCMGEKFYSIIEPWAIKSSTLNTPLINELKKINDYENPILIKFTIKE
jgi:hypothetical protein